MRRLIAVVCTTAALTLGGLAVSSGTALADAPHHLGCGVHQHFDGHRCVPDFPAHRAGWFQPAAWFHAIHLPHFHAPIHHSAPVHHPAPPHHDAPHHGGKR